MVFRFGKFCVVWSTVITSFLGLIIVASLSLLYMKPIPIKEAFIRSFLPTETAKNLSYEDMRLGFDRNFVLKTKNLSFKKNGEELFVEDAKIIISFPHMLIGRLRPSHIYLNGVKTPNAVLSKEALYFAGVKVPFNTGGNKNIVKVLNAFSETYPFLSQLKTLRISRFEGHLEDVIQQKNWILKPIEILFKRTFLKGERFSIETRLFDKNDTKKEIPFQFIMNHKRQANYLTAILRTKNLNLKAFQAYLPKEIPLSGTLETEIFLQLDDDKNMHITSTKSTIEDAKIRLSKLYTNTLDFKKVYFDLEMNNNLKKIKIKKLDAEDHTGFAFDLSGYIDLKHKKEPFVHVSLKGKSETTLKNINSYLPNKRIKGVTNWINTHSKTSLLNHVNFSYMGNPLHLPHCPETGCGFAGHFTFKNTEMHFLPQLTKAQNLNGHFNMKKGHIHIDVHSGSFKNQKIGPKTTVDIKPLFNKDIPVELNASGTLSGDVKELLETIKPLTKTDKPWRIDDVLGTHETDLFLSIPLLKPQFKHIRLETASQVKNVISKGYTSGHTLALNTAEVHLSKIPEEQSFILSGTGEGRFENQDIHMRWYENLKKPLSQTKVFVTTKIPNKKVMSVLKDKGIFIEKDIPLFLEISDIQAKPITIKADLRLNQNAISLTDLNWQKEPGETLSLKGNVAFNNADNFHVKSFLFTGDDLNGKGSFIRKNKASALTLTDFKIGKSYFNAQIDDTQTKLTGQVLDLSFLDLSQIGKKEKTPKKQVFSASIEQILLPNGMLNNGSLKLFSDKTGFKSFSLNATLPEEKAISITIDREKNETKQTLPKNIDLHVYAENGGYALNAINITNKFDKGILKIDGTLNNSGEGLLNVHLKDVQLIEAPILFQLFSVLAIEDLINFNKGLHFDSIRMPLKITKEHYVFNPLTMKGPSVNLRAKGTLSKAGELNGKGQLVPMSRLNKLITKIPVVGKAITGSQGALMVADFTATGDIKNPEISSNPFSLITPGLLKDLFGIIRKEEEDPLLKIEKQPKTEQKIKPTNKENQ